MNTIGHGQKVLINSPVSSVSALTKSNVARTDTIVYHC